MGTILTSVKQTVIKTKDKLCGVYDIFSYEQELAESVITKFEFDPEDHYRNAGSYQYQDPPKSNLR